MTPTWTILIATLAQRAPRFERVVNELLPQTESYDGAVRLCAFFNRGEHPLGHVRQALVEHVTSTYVSFVDDDDLVPSFHVDSVMSVLPDEPDYVGWRMQCFADGVALKPTVHSLRYTGWFDDENGYYRDVSHLNPIRRDLALRADFRRGEPPEDVSWADQVRPHVHGESFVDRVMYYYHSSSSDSTWRGVGVECAYVGTRLPIEHPHFDYHPGSST